MQYLLKGVVEACLMHTIQIIKSLLLNPLFISNDLLLLLSTTAKANRSLAINLGHARSRSKKGPKISPVGNIITLGQHLPSMVRDHRQIDEMIRLKILNKETLVGQQVGQGCDSGKLKFKHLLLESFISGVIILMPRRFP